MEVLHQENWTLQVTDSLKVRESSMEMVMSHVWVAKEGELAHSCPLPLLSISAPCPSPVYEEEELLVADINIMFVRIEIDLDFPLMTSCCDRSLGFLISLQT